MSNEAEFSNSLLNDPIESDDENDENLRHIVTNGELRRLDDVRAHLSRHPEKACDLLSIAANNADACPSGEYLDLMIDVAIRNGNPEGSAIGIANSMVTVHQRIFPDEVASGAYIAYRDWVLRSTRNGVSMATLFAGILDAHGLNHTANFYRDFSAIPRFSINIGGGRTYTLIETMMGRNR